MTAGDPIESPGRASTSRAASRDTPLAGGPRRRGEGRKERKKQKRNCRTTLSALLRRANGKYLSVIFIGAPSIAARCKRGAARKGGTTPQPLLLNQGCWLSLRDGMARYKIPGVTPLLTVQRRAMRSPLRPASTETGRWGGEGGRGVEKDTLDAAIAGTLAGAKSHEITTARLVITNGSRRTAGIVKSRDYGKCPPRINAGVNRLLYSRRETPRSSKVRRSSSRFPPLSVPLNH